MYEIFGSIDKIISDKKEKKLVVCKIQLRSFYYEII